MKVLLGVVTAGLTLGASVVMASAATTQVVETNHGWVDYHSAAKLSSPIEGRLDLGQKAPLVNKVNRWWYEINVNGRDVYITTNSHYTHLATESTSTSTPPVATQPATSAPAPSVPTTSTPSTSTTGSTPTPANDIFHVTEGNGVPVTINISSDTPQEQKLIRTAISQLGVPYWWGHQVPNYAPVNGRDGFDCSNFVAWTYKTALGIDFSGSSVYQRFHVGTPVSLKTLQPGDLLFFANASHPNGQGHVGMYVGNNLIIQEGGGRGKVTVESLNNSRAWFGRSLVFARQVL